MVLLLEYFGQPFGQEEVVDSIAFFRLSEQVAFQQLSYRRLNGAGRIEIVFLDEFRAVKNTLLNVYRRNYKLESKKFLIDEQKSMQQFAKVQFFIYFCSRNNEE